MEKIERQGMANIKETKDDTIKYYKLGSKFKLERIGSSVRVEATFD